MRINSQCKTKDIAIKKIIKIKNCLLKIDEWDSMASGYSPRVAEHNLGKRPKLFIDGIQVI